MIGAKTAESIDRDAVWLWTWIGPMKHVLDGAQIPHAKVQLLGERVDTGMPDDTLPRSV